MNAKRLKQTAAALMIAAVAFAGCKKDDPDEKQSYTVTFNSAGGSAVEAQTVEAGGTATKPENPTRTGYVFDNWYPGSASEAYGFNTPVTSNITLTAKWLEDDGTIEYWNITWNLGGGAWPEGVTPSAKVVRGGSLAEPNAPVKEGSTFEGWYSDAALTNKITFPCTVTADMALYAKWTGESGGNAELSIYPAYTQFMFPPRALTSDPFTVTTNQPAWDVASSQSWCTVSKSGNTFTISSADNYGEARTATVTVSAGTAASITIDVSQDKGVHPLEKAKYSLAYTIQIKEALNKGQTPTHITNSAGKTAVTVTYNANQTVKYILFNTGSSSGILDRTTITSFGLNQPMAICELWWDESAIGVEAAQAIYRGTYDYAGNPASVIAYFGTFAGNTLFTSLNELKKMANNNGITQEVCDKISFPTNCYKVIVFSKGTGGELTGKYVGYSLTGETFTYWCIDPDNADFGKSATVAIP